MRPCCEIVLISPRQENASFYILHTTFISHAVAYYRESYYNTALTASADYELIKEETNCIFKKNPLSTSYNAK